MHFGDGGYDIIFSDDGSGCLAFCITHFRTANKKTGIKGEIFFLAQRCPEFIDDPGGLIDCAISYPFIKYSGRMGLFTFHFQ